MKGLLAILLIGALQHVNADCVDGNTGYSCECVTMLTSLTDPSKPDLNAMMYYLKIKGLTSCDENVQKACSSVCLEKVRQAGDSSDPSENRPDGKTANEISCLMLRGDVNKRTSVIYSRVCNKDWKAVATINTNVCCHQKKPC